MEEGEIRAIGPDRVRPVQGHGEGREDLGVSIGPKTGPDAKIGLVVALVKLSFSRCREISESAGLQRLRLRQMNVQGRKDEVVGGSAEPGLISLGVETGGLGIGMRPEYDVPGVLGRVVEDGKVAFTRGEVDDLGRQRRGEQQG